MRSAGGRRAVRQPARKVQRSPIPLYCCAAILVVSVGLLCSRLLHQPVPASVMPLASATAKAMALQSDKPSASVFANASASAFAAASVAALQAPASASPQVLTPSLAPTTSPSPTPGKTSGNSIAKTQPAISQLIVVISSGGSAARVSLYELEAGEWVKRLGVSGCVGKAGLAAAGDKVEGDMKTPKGLFSLGFAFGTEKPDTLLDFRPITKNSYWVDDPVSEYYNTWQEGFKGWKSAEKLISHANCYHYAVVVNYNTARAPGRGSAIFFHCKTRAYTSGCVAIPEKSMLVFLHILDPAKHPSMLIASSAAEVNRFGLVNLP